MEIDKKHIVKRVWVNVCRFLLGGVFIFSGFVKAIDSFGTFYKLQDYLVAFGMGSWIPSSLLFVGAMLLAALEFCIGVYLFLGIRRTWSAWMAVLLMAVMTPLTLYLAIANPVSDCGCFGDAWVLTNWETFGKNIILFVAAFSVFRWRKDVIRFITRKIEWVFSMYTILFVFALSIYCQHNLPIIDFRPYKVGVNILQAMEIPEGAKPPVYDTRFILEKGGIQKEFTLDNYPKNDTTWTFVDQRSTLIKKGYEPPIHDFAIEDEEWNDITDDVLAYEGQTYLVVAYDLKLADEGAMAQVQRLYNRCVLSRDTRCYVLTASTDEDIEQLRQRTGVTYPFCKMDPITLKTIIRSNPGIVLIQGGTVQAKWAWRDFFND